MSDMRYIVRDTQTGERFVWDLTQVLEEINRDRSADWTPYTKDGTPSLIILRLSGLCVSL